MYISIALGVVWILGMMLTMKLDAVLAQHPTDYKYNTLISCVVWPIIAVLLLTCKHRSNSFKVTYDY